MEIIVPKGLKAVHSLDLWGPVVDAYKLGSKKMELYRAIAADQKIDQETIEKVASDFKALLEGQPWATGERKRDIINSVEGPIKASKMSTNYDGVFQEDGLQIIKEIYDAGEGVIIFTSAEASWLKPNLPNDLGRIIGEIYADKKTDPEAFKRVHAAEAAQNRYVITHTADELPELEAAVRSGLFQKQGLIYVNRNNSNPRDLVLAKGIGRYVDNLHDVDYAKIVHK